MLPLALLGGSGADRSDPEPANPSPTKAVDPNAQGVPTLQSGVIAYQEGPQIPLQGDLRDRADGFALLGSDRYVVTAATADGERGASLVDDRGTELATYPLEGGLRRAARWRGRVDRTPTARLGCWSRDLTSPGRSPPSKGGASAVADHRRLQPTICTVGT